MRIEAKCTIKHHPYYLEPGDTKTVDDAAGAVMVAHGWARNLDTGEDHDPVINAPPAALAIKSVLHATSVKVEG